MSIGASPFVDVLCKYQRRAASLVPHATENGAEIVFWFASFECVAAQLRQRVSNDHVKRHSDEVPRGEVCKLLQTKRCRAAKENVVSANRDRAQHGHASAVVFKSGERGTRPRG
jgi:hypothetical protein